MKITKRRWSNISPLYTYRHEKCGKLVKRNDSHTDYTGALFQDRLVHSAFTVSMQGRLLKTDQTGKNPRADRTITDLVIALCKGYPIDLIISRLSKASVTPADAIRRIDDTLSNYGKSYPEDRVQTKMGKAISILMTTNEGEAHADAIAALKEIQKTLRVENAHRIARVKNSIQGNRTPLRVEEDQVVANTERAKWFLNLMDASKGGVSCYPVISAMEGIANIEGLSQKLKVCCEAEKGKPRNMSLAVNNALREHCQSLWQKTSAERPDQLENLRYYYQELHAYFREHFPIRTKSVGTQERQGHLKNQSDVDILLAPGHIKGAVWRGLVNKSTQIHIMYGKLMEYCTGENALEVNSDTLQKIQVIEAVKKQLITALSWAISRLYDFCDFDDEKYDIFDDRQIQNCLTNPVVLAALPAKLGAFFPTETLSPEDEKTLIFACKNCIYALRICLFHFAKKSNLMNAIDSAANQALVGKDITQKQVLQQLYQKDRESLGNVFAEKLSSMNLPLYYADDLLETMFSHAGTRFELYGDPYQMTPSFRRVYRRGNDLAKDIPDLRWFLHEEPVAADTNACHTIRNLLQILYYYSFLPAVQKNEAFITDHIPGVLDRNQRLAENSKNQKAVGYAEIRAFYQPTMPLSELMIQLQRDISDTEQESLEKAQQKIDYSQRFLSDIFSLGFNHYLDAYFSNVYAEVMNPQRRNDPSAMCKVLEVHTGLPASLTDHLLVLYPILRLLDGQELSELQQQMKRYRAYLGKDATAVDQTTSPEQILIIEELIELVKLTEPLHNDVRNAYGTIENDIAPFLEGDPNHYGDFYTQSNDRTPVLHRNVMRMQRTGILDIYQGKIPLQATPTH